MRPTLRNGLADVLMVLPLLVAGWLAYQTWRGYILFWVILTIVVVQIARAFYRQHRASGFGEWVSVLLIAMRFTVVLDPLARGMGVRQGSLKPCARCGGFRFAWAPWPHCAGETGARPPDAVAPSPTAVSWPWSILMPVTPKADPGAFFYRFILPLYFLLLWSVLQRF